MALEAFTNDGLGTVTFGGTTAPSAGTVESWTVSVTNPFPVASSSASVPTSFYVCDQSPSFETEKVLVTVCPGGGPGSQVWTVTRGVDGTTPVAHTAGFTIVQVVVRASLQALQQPWLVKPSGDSSGATDPANVTNAMNAYGLAQLTPGTYWAGSAVIGNEAQFVRGPGRQITTWNLVTAGQTGFKWQPKSQTNDGSGYSQTGTGGITGVSIVGPSGTANPVDGSIGVQLGDIVQLECDVYVSKLNYGLFMSNEWYWTEQSQVRVHATSCYYPVTLQWDPAGPGSFRTGSFDRLHMYAYCNDAFNSGSSSAVRLINGAQVYGGLIDLTGNIGGVSGNYFLSISGSNSSRLPTVSSIDGATMRINAEVDSGTAQTVLVDTGCYVTNTAGQVSFNAFSNGTVNGTWQFFGPIEGDDSLLQVNGNKTGVNILPLIGGVTGNMTLAQSGAPGMAYIEGNLNIPGTTSLTTGAQLAGTAPLAFRPASNRSVVMSLYNGTYQFAAPVTINSSGIVTWGGTAYTTPAPSALNGSTLYQTR